MRRERQPVLQRSVGHAPYSGELNSGYTQPSNWTSTGALHPPDYGYQIFNWNKNLFRPKAMIFNLCASYLTTVIIILFLNGFIILPSAHAEDAKPNENLSPEVIVNKLKLCPCWLEVPYNDTKRREQITKIYLDLSRHKTENLRNGIELYLEKYNRIDNNSFLAGAKVFAFLRVIFDLPEHYKVRPEQIIHLMGNPMNEDGTVDLMWPYSKNDQGDILLTGESPPFFSGPPYNGLADFDGLASEFGRRKWPQ